MANFIKNIVLQNKRVFLRVDCNVPMDNGKIVHDHRLKAILPTIDYLLEQNCTIVLATHIGRPDAQSRPNFFDEKLSTKILVPWFESHGYEIDYEIDLKRAIEKSKENNKIILGKIILLENLRFFNEEKAVNKNFAELLAQCADVYINDAFGVMHRHDTSVTLLPEEFDEDKRAFGFVVEKELKILEALKSSPGQPFVIVLGGSKIKTKLTVLDRLFEQPDEKRVKTIIIGGAIANTLLKAQEINIGASKIESELIPLAHDFLEKAKSYGVKILLPIDVFIATKKLDKPAETCDINEGHKCQIPENLMIVDIGPKTIKMFSKEISGAKTIFSNGTMGIYEKKDYQLGSKKILEAIANSGANTIIGGGDAVTATHLFGLEDKMSFLSTGGGSTLVFLAKK